MANVATYILSTGPDSESTKRIKSLFLTDLFAVNVVVIAPPNNSKVDADSYRTRWVLMHAASHYPDSYVLIVKETSTSVANAQAVKDVVKAAIQGNGWDVCYLCRWQDDCDKNTDRQEVAGTGANIVRTYAPQGSHAILLSPKGRDILLGKQTMKNGQLFSSEGPIAERLTTAVAQGNISAICTDPNLISVDVSGTPNEVWKKNECKPGTGGVGGASGSGNPNGASGSGGANGTNPNGQNADTGSAISIWWIILILLLLIVVTWAVLRIGPQPK